ncbi:MAG: hypothetical protein AAGF12_23370 [Myxococcota bacterium]
MDRSYCDDPAHEEFGTCFYSDLSLYENGPPEGGSCPAFEDELTGFCGGPCGEGPCPVAEILRGLPAIEPSRLEVSCVGMNEERGFGVCSFEATNACARGASWSVVEVCPLFGRTCTCMVQRGPDRVLQDAGFAMSLEACLAYRAEFPEGVECVDQDWQPLP